MSYIEYIIPSDSIIYCASLALSFDEKMYSRGLVLTRFTFHW